VIVHVDGDERVRLRAGFRQFAQQRFERLARARERSDARTEVREFQRGRATDALGSAANERVSAGKVQVHCNSL